jgi:predicted transcriptional regulator
MSFSPEIVPLLQSLIIAGGNVVGIIIAYVILERRTDKKIDKYWKRIKSSEEGGSALELLGELKKLSKSPEAKELIKEAYATFKELREIMKKLKERMEEAPEGEDTEEKEFTLPKIGS